MKRSRIAMSALLVPALVMAGAGGTGCAGGRGGSTPPALNLPATLTGVQAVTTGPTTFSLTVSGVAAGLDISNATYGVWCVNPAGFVPSSIVDTSQNPAVLFDASGVATYSVYNSYAPTTYTAGPNTGFPGQVHGASTMLSLTQEWSAVNYILNHLTGTNGNIPATANDIQAAIWQLLHPTDGVAYVTNTGTDSYAVALYNDAVANGVSFIPGNGQFAAAILVPQTPAGSPQPYQGVLIPVTVKGGGCTGTSSAMLYKTASVTNANSFQAITYSYTVANTGTTTLTNLVVTDDNGTPNYSEDDFTVTTIASLAPGATAGPFCKTVYLPIRLFYQSGSTVIWDTLIPQISAPNTPANSLLLTYLTDVDVTDNTYGTGASAGWKTAGGHTFSQILGNYAEFAFYDKCGNLVSDFNADYLSHVGVSGSAPSGYASAGLHGSPIWGGTQYIDYITSTLADNLNGYSKFYGDTMNSPVNDANWQTIAGYKVLVNPGIFGWFGMGSAAVKKNYLNASESSVSGCGFSSHGVSYTPQVVRTQVVGTAWLSASVLNCCSTTVTAKASTCVTLNGCAPPTCAANYAHKCQHQDECRCTCANCLAGLHSKCTQQNCSDPRCQDKGCPLQCQCHCQKCSSGDHLHCARIGCTDTHCHLAGCPQSSAAGTPQTR